MPLDDDTTARIAQPDFWPLYFFDDQAMEEYEEAREDGDEAEAEQGEVFRPEFLLDDGLGLKLDFELGTEYVDLALLAPGSGEETTVGWDDTAHFHPHVMTWSELDLLCRAAALHDPGLRHPGPMLALLLRFAFHAEGDDLDAITPVVDAAFEAVRPAAVDGGDAPRRPARVRSETREWFDLRDLRGTGLRWVVRPDGHRAVAQPDGGDGMPLYSLRAPEAEEFPFAAWSALLSRAEDLLTAVRSDPALRAADVRAALEACTGPEGHTHLAPLAAALSAAGFRHSALLRAVGEPIARAEAAWAVETLAARPRGSVTAAWFGPSPLTGSRTWRLALTLPAAGRPYRFAQDVAAELSAALEDAGLGWAETTGSTSRQDENGTYVLVENLLDVLVRDDLPGAVGLISRVLHARQAAETAVLRHEEQPRDRIPLPAPPA
ncbi:MAG: hypothetical protein HOY69_32555 [Streptomyces sp.]|nr:hypothetical protein [Streptomyces sp.]